MSDNLGERRHDVDRSGSIVSGPAQRHLTTIQKLGVAGVILTIFLAFIWLGEGRRKTKEELREPDQSVMANAAAFRPAPIVTPPRPVSLPPPQPSSRLQPAKNEVSPADSPIFAFSGSEGTTPPAPIRDALQPAAAQAGEAAETALSVKLKPTILQPTKAAMLPHPDMLVTQGTIIPCTLQTAIDTSLAGYVKCVLPQDVRGTTGNVVLLDRGTTVVGEIQSSLQQGQDRVFVLWDRAETPNHAVITLASPGTDELGRSGLPGTVNTHFWQRFGSALLLSVVQGSLQAGAAVAGSSGNGNGTVFNSFQSNGEQLSDTALRNSIGIPPTLEKNQGDTIAIFVAKDLDFSDIYSLRYVGLTDDPGAGHP